MAHVTFKDLTHITFLDPGSGKSKDQLKKRSARSAIVTIAYDWLNRIFVRTARAARVDTNVLYDMLLEEYSIYNPRVIGIEANAQQTLFVDQLIRRAQAEGKTIPFQAVYQSTKVEKNWRIKTAIQPKLGNGQLFIDRADPRMLELTAEFETFPMSSTVDLVDALASAIALVPPRSIRRVVDDETRQRLAYLRSIGAPPRIIEQVARGER